MSGRRLSLWSEKLARKNSEAIQKSACEGDDSWSYAVEPETAEESRDAQHKDGSTMHVSHV